MLADVEIEEWTGSDSDDESVEIVSCIDAETLFETSETVIFEGQPIELDDEGNTKLFNYVESGVSIVDYVRDNFDYCQLCVFFHKAREVNVLESTVKYICNACDIEALFSLFDERLPLKNFLASSNEILVYQATVYQNYNFLKSLIKHSDFPSVVGFNRFGYTPLELAHVLRDRKAVEIILGKKETFRDVFNAIKKENELAHTQLKCHIDLLQEAGISQTVDSEANAHLSRIEEYKKIELMSEKKVEENFDLSFSKKISKLAFYLIGLSRNKLSVDLIRKIYFRIREKLYLEAMEKKFIDDLSDNVNGIQLFYNKNYPWVDPYTLSVREGNVRAVANLINPESGSFDVNKMYPLKGMPLVVAVSNGDWRMVKVLLDFNIKINLEDPLYGQVLFNILNEIGKNPGDPVNKEILTILKSRKMILANISEKILRQLKNLIFESKNKDVFKLAVDLGIGFTESSGWVMYSALDLGGGDLVTWVLGRNININLNPENHDRNSHLFEAIENFIEHKVEEGVISLLIDRGARFSGSDSDSDLCSLFYEIVDSGRGASLFKSLVENFKININDFDGEESSYLACAIKNGDLEMIESLVDLGAKIHVINSKNPDPPLSLAVKKFLEPKSEDKKCLYDQIIKYLVEKDKGCVASSDRCGVKPIHYAVEDYGLVAFLVRNNASINSVDDSGCSVLMSAASEGKVDVINLLLDKGADPLRKDEDGGSMLIYLANCEGCLTPEENKTSRLINESKDSELKIKEMIMSFIRSVCERKIKNKRKPDEVVSAQPSNKSCHGFFSESEPEPEPEYKIVSHAGCERGATP